MNVRHIFRKNCKSSVGTKSGARKRIYHECKVQTDKSVPRVTVWLHSAEPHDAKTVTIGTDLSVRTSHSCQILIMSHLRKIHIIYMHLVSISSIFWSIASFYSRFETSLDGIPKSMFLTLRFKSTLSCFSDTFHKDLSVEACKCFISLLDIDNSGKLGYTEFLQLWSLLRSWKVGLDI